MKHCGNQDGVHLLRSLVKLPRFLVPKPGKMGRLEAVVFTKFQEERHSSTRVVFDGTNFMVFLFIDHMARRPVLTGLRSHRRNWC
jgi:hypothetical protein